MTVRPTLQFGQSCPRLLGQLVRRAVEQDAHRRTVEGRLELPEYQTQELTVDDGVQLRFGAVEPDPAIVRLQPEERRGTKLEFRKSLLLYNGHAIREPVRDLYVVEGFASTWWLHQAGFGDTVAVMGSSCSVEQKELILRLVSPSGRVWLLPDGDKAGDRCAAEMLELIAPHRFCRWVRLKEGQPTDLSPDELVRLLEWKVVP